MIQRTISDFRISFYIPEIQNLAFHLPCICILGAHHCGNTHSEEFKHCEYFQDALCCCDYAEQVVASFAHQIQSEYHGVNICVSIEVIVLEQFSDTKHPLQLFTPQSRTRHSMFHSFFMITINNMLSQQLYIPNSSYNC